MLADRPEPETEEYEEEDAKQRRSCRFGKSAAPGWRFFQGVDNSLAEVRVQTTNFVSLWRSRSVVIINVRVCAGSWNRPQLK
jgi:hypothetical protein